MKITELSAIVAVRNHIETVKNNPALSQKSDFAVLDQARKAFDKKFIDTIIEAAKSQKIDMLFEDYTTTPETTADSIFETAKKSQVFVVAGVNDLTQDTKMEAPINVDETPLNKPKPEPPPVDDELQKRIVEEKAALKKKVKKAKTNE